ncbi:hypothetical protein [Actinosynnema pretiosum]|uniref:hypothetical protein n=1 Tax=Actinosynnema pretiosum TaxID=42197 RepID=UPI0012FD0683|nr:hypothetical protein [Actinosynnema pretiosum]
MGGAATAAARRRQATADKACSSPAGGRPPSVDRDVHEQRHAVERGINTWLRHI